MPVEALVVPLFVGSRVLFQSVLHGAAQGDVRVDNPVGFGNDTSVDTARLVVGRGAMVFYGFFHCLYFFFGKPLAQSGICHHYFTGDKVVRGTIAAQPRIVIGGNGIDHTLVRFGMLPGKGKALFDDGLYMREVMSFVKIAISGNDFCFDVGGEGFGYHALFCF